MSDEEEKDGEGEEETSKSLSDDVLEAFDEDAAADEDSEDEELGEDEEEVWAEEMGLNDNF